MNNQTGTIVGTMSVHQATFELFVGHLNELVERTSQAAPGTPLPDSTRELCNETMVIQAQDLTNNPEFVRLLQAIATMCESNSDIGNAYIEGMRLWREAQLAVADGLEVVSDAVSHAIEVLFGVTILRILLVPDCSDGLPDDTRDYLEEIASTHLLRSVTKGNTRTSSGVWSAAAVQVRFAQRDICDPTAIDTGGDEFSFHELYFPDASIWFDSVVVAEVSARIVGVLSYSKLYSVTARFLPRLETAIRTTPTKDKALRQTRESIEIIWALRYVRLGFQQLDYSIDFLTKIVTVVEQQRLSAELKHEVCALLIACLERIPTDERVTQAGTTDGKSSEVSSGSGSKAWDQVVARTYKRLWDWAVKPKYLAASCRALSALLVSFSLEAHYVVEHAQALVQLLVKHCSDKSLRGVMLASFRTIVKVRLSLPVRGFVNSTLTKTVEFGFAHLFEEIFCRPDSKSKTKGKEKEDGQTLTMTQLDLLVEAAVLFGARDRGCATHTESSGLNFVIEKLVVPSLERTQESGQRKDDMQFQFGMQVFIGICREYEGTLDKPRVSEVTTFNPKVLMEPSLQRYARKIGPPFATLLTHYTGEVARQEAVQSESLLVRMVITLVDCIPRVIPLMPYDKLQKNLLSLALAPLKDIRDAVLACFVRFIHIWPPLRLTIVRSFFEQIIRIKDSGSTRDSDRIVRSARSVKVIVDEWAMLGCLTRRAQYNDGSVGTFHGIRREWAASGENEDSFGAGPIATVVIEQIALYLLCSTHPEIRSYGFELLQSSHNLEERLIANAKPESRRLSIMQVLEHAAPAIIERASVGVPSPRKPESSGGSFSQLVGFALSNQGDHDQVRWCRCLAELCNFVAALRSNVGSLFCQIAAQAAKATGPSVQGTKIQVDKWRNYTVAALCSVNQSSPEESVPNISELGKSQEDLIVDLMELVKTVLYGSESTTHRSASVLVLGLAASPTVYKVYRQDLLLLNAVSMDLQQMPTADSDLLQEQLRTDLMTVHRMIAERLQLSGSEHEKKIDDLLCFIENTVAYSTSTVSMHDRSTLFELRTLRVDFCLVVRYVAEAAYGDSVTKFTSDVRSRTFSLLSEWCTYGMRSGTGLQRRQIVDAEHEKHLEQTDDLNMRQTLVNRYNQSWSRLETEANHSICYLFWGPVMEHTDPDLIFTWVKHLVHTIQDPKMWHPLLDAVEKHLISTPALLQKYLDQCYDTGQLLGENSTQLLFFHAITGACSRTAYSEESDLAGLVILALYHSTSASEAVRNEAAMLLRILIRQSESESNLPSFTNVYSPLTTSSIPDVFESASKLVSSKLSTEFPDLSGRVLLEVFRRLAIRLTAETQAARVARCNTMLSILKPWMQNFVLGDYRRAASPSFSSGSFSPVGATGSPCSVISQVLSQDSNDLASSQILDYIFSLTQSLGVEHSREIEMIWRNIVMCRSHNVAPVVTYCIDKVVDTYENDPEGFFLLVAQQVTVYMARCHTDLTVRILMDQVSMLPEIPSLTISRSNVATILLVEIIHESPSVHLSDHTPLLLHLAIIGMDHDDEQYAEHCSHLLINLLQTMVMKDRIHEDPLSNIKSACTYDKVVRLIQFLQSRDAQGTWRDDDKIVAPGTERMPPADLEWAVSCIIDSMMHAVPDLRLKWSNVALQYPLMDRREDVVVRSHQIFRVLCHEVQLQHAKQLLFSGHAYCYAGSDGIPFLAETAATIQCMIHQSDQIDRLCVLFPQFFWFAAALSQSETPVLYIVGLRLFRAMLPIYAMNNDAHRSLQAGLVAAKSWSRPFRGVQELVIRGLGTAQTEEHSISTLRVLLSVALTRESDMIITGRERSAGANSSNSLAVQLVGVLLPWLCHHLEEASISSRQLHPDASSTARDIVTFCDQCGLQMLALPFIKYAETTNRAEISEFGVSAFLTSLSDPFRAAMCGVGIPGKVYGPWLAHLGQAPAGLHARRYANHVLKVLLVVLRDPKHLLASRMTSAEQETAAQLGETRDVLPQDAILPLLIKRVSDFATVRDLSDTAIQVLNAAAIAEKYVTVNTDTPKMSETVQRHIVTHQLDRIAVGNPGRFDEECTALKGIVVQAWSSEPRSDTYLSLQLGDEVVVTSQRRANLTPVDSHSWSSGFVTRRRTASGLLVPLTNTAEGSFPTECIRLENQGSSGDPSGIIPDRSQHGNDNSDAARALFAICRTLPGSTHPQQSLVSTSQDRTATSDEHALWLESPIVIPSEQTQQSSAVTGLLLKPRFVSVVPAGSGRVQQKVEPRVGRGPTSEVRYQSPNRPTVKSPEQAYDSKGGITIDVDASSLGKLAQGSAIKPR